VLLARQSYGGRRRGRLARAGRFNSIRLISPTYTTPIQDICSTQLIELCTIPILGFIGPILRGTGHCDVFNLSEEAPEHVLTLGVFVSFLTEALVDVGSAYVERRQGIRTETWWQQVTVLQLGSMCVYMLAGVAYVLWMQVDVSGELAESCGVHTEAGGLNATLVNATALLNHTSNGTSRG